MKIIKNNQEKDRFIQIAAGGKKMTGEVKRLKEILPPTINHVALNPTTEKYGLKSPIFNEEKEYQKFLKEKEELKKYYLPFLENYAQKVESDEIQLVDFKFRKETEDDKLDFFSVLSGKGEW